MNLKQGLDLSPIFVLVVLVLIQIVLLMEYEPVSPDASRPMEGSVQNTALLDASLSSDVLVSFDIGTAIDATQDKANGCNVEYAKDKQIEFSALGKMKDLL